MARPTPHWVHSVSWLHSRCKSNRKVGKLCGPNEAAKLDDVYTGPYPIFPLFANCLALRFSFLCIFYVYRVHDCVAVRQVHKKCKHAASTGMFVRLSVRDLCLRVARLFLAHCCGPDCWTIPSIGAKFGVRDAWFLIPTSAFWFLIPDSWLLVPELIEHSTDRAASISISASAGHVFLFFLFAVPGAYKKVYANVVLFTQSAFCGRCSCVVQVSISSGKKIWSG